MPDFFCETPRNLPLHERHDVIVAGGGPAGIAAAVAAARQGARTLLLETQGCLGGVWTSGLLAWVIDAGGKGGIMAEIFQRIRAAELKSTPAADARNFAFDVEQMKLLLERMITEANVEVCLHTRVVGAARDSSNRLRVILTESKNGREAWAAPTFIDATGDGDLAAQAGCTFALGRPNSGECQPMSLLALVTGVEAKRITPFLGGGLKEPKRRLFSEFQRAGIEPSYSSPILLHLNDDLYAFIANHEYGVSALDAKQITAATLRAREELNRLVAALRKLGEPWSGLRLVSTASHIGVREGRRIRGHYTVTEQDLIEGRRHPDAICHVNFGIDVHATNPTISRDYENTGKRALPYDIPVGALIAADVDGLLLAGRCISGDFIAHASYRVTGNAVQLGEAAGCIAALAAHEKALPQQLPWEKISVALTRLNASSPLIATEFTPSSPVDAKTA